jgi:hypothetical protein
MNNINNLSNEEKLIKLIEDELKELNQNYNKIIERETSFLEKNLLKFEVERLKHAFIQYEKINYNLTLRKEKYLNHNCQEEFMDEDKFFNICQTLFEVVAENLKDTKNIVNKTDITLKLGEALENKKITETDAKTVKQVFKYYIVAENIHQEYSDHNNYSSLRNTAILAYQNMNKNSQEIILQYVNKDFLKIEDQKF